MGACVIIMLVFQMIPLCHQAASSSRWGTRKTSLKGLVYALFKNDQLLITALGMGLLSGWLYYDH